MRLKILFFILLLIVFVPYASAEEETPALNVDYTKTIYEYFFKIKEDIEPVAEKNNLDFFITDLNSDSNLYADIMFVPHNSDVDIRLKKSDNYYYLSLYNLSDTSIPSNDCQIRSYSNYESALNNCISIANNFATSTNKPIESGNYFTSGYFRFYSYKYTGNKSQDAKPIYISNTSIPLNLDGLSELKVTHATGEVTNPTNVSDLFYLNCLESHQSSGDVEDTTATDTLFFVKAIFYLILCLIIYILFRACMRFLRFLIPF